MFCRGETSKTLSRASECVGFGRVLFFSIHGSPIFRKSVFVQKRGGFAKGFMFIDAIFRVTWADFSSVGGLLWRWAVDLRTWLSQTLLLRSGDF